ncbi:hypothetical protein EXIGLDRAFT_779892 [Exidia glandulosa HHB12029]|uniref:Protein kinase domain-containing protein n=1 Tax=Exidia glandulosa HHB12029 TaxID=1314781 RepID=A0A165BUU0_EXIGL|nr:hypothetical protein EXIGLDRAFT_779892 [Exidia glandulosa HHB12029]
MRPNVCIVARPLSQFSSDHELLQGLASIAKVLSCLHAQGLVHGHITYSNVLLCDSQPEPTGILIDFDFMLSCDSKTTPSDGHQVEFSRIPWLQRKQRVWHANEYFAAYEVLRSNSLHASTQHHFTYAPAHDAESTYWVIGYTILERVLESFPESERKLQAYTSDAHGIEHSTSTLYGELMAILDTHFGSVDSDMGSILCSRQDGGPLRWWTKDPKMAALVTRVVHEPTLRLLLAMAKEVVQPLQNALAYVMAEGLKIARNEVQPDESVPPHTTFELAKLKGHVDTALAAERARLGLHGRMCTREEGGQMTDEQAVGEPVSV